MPHMQGWRKTTRKAQGGVNELGSQGKYWERKEHECGCPNTIKNQQGRVHIFCDNEERMRRKGH